MGGVSRDYECRGDAEWLMTDDAGATQAGKSAATAECASRAALEATIGRAFHMRVLKEIAHLAENYPELPLVLTENKISIRCTVPGGFSMSIQTARGRYVVCLDEWRDEFALAGEAVELIESALRGDIRIRVDISTAGRRHAAERRLPTGEWISLPSFEDTIDGTSTGKLVRTVYLRNGPVLV